MRATFALFLATGLVLGGTTMGPSAGAATTGHGGGYPDPTATAPPAPTMGAYNGYNGYGTNGGAPAQGPAQTPAPGVPVSGVTAPGGPAPVTAPPAREAPATGVPTSPAGAPPLAISRGPQARAGDPTCTTALTGPPLVPGVNQPVSPPGGVANDDPTTCFVETQVTFTVQTGVLSLTCPTWAPSNDGGATAVDQETTPGGTIEIPIGTCAVNDLRGGTVGGTWMVSAAMDAPFCNTGTPAFCIPDANVHYVINPATANYINILDPTGLSPTDLTNLAPPTGTTNPPGVILPAPTEAPPGPYTSPTGVDVLQATGAPAIYSATWNPTLTVTVPPGAPLAVPPNEYRGTLTTTVTG